MSDFADRPTDQPTAQLPRSMPDRVSATSLIRPTLPPIPVWGQSIASGPVDPIAQVQQILQHLPVAKLEAALTQILHILGGRGIRLYVEPSEYLQASVAPDIYRVGLQPSGMIGSRKEPIEAHLIWRRFLQQGEVFNYGNPQLSSRDAWVIENLQLDFRLRTLAAAFAATPIGHILIVPIRYEQVNVGCLTIFRAIADAPWGLAEIAQLQGFAQKFATVLQQHYMGERLTRLNQELILQSHDLHQMVSHQESLSNVMQKVRASIDLEHVFYTTVQELYQLFKADRVVVYRFKPDWSGEFIAEAVGQQWRSLKVDQTDPQYADEQGKNNLTKPDCCIVKTFQNAPVLNIDSHLHDTQGGTYAHNPAVKQINDIYQSGFTDCYLEVLEAYQCRAYMTAPIYKNGQLWGLLSIYQNTGARQWLAFEVELAKQIATQLGIAIQQGELLEKTQSQAAKLTKAVATIRSNQAQIIQAEKMVSLGQLVAGIAHEVNNPINFIHGNLNHLKGYYGEIMGLLELCQQYKGKLPTIMQAYLESIDVDFMTGDIPKLIQSMQSGTTRVSEIVLSLRNFSRLDEAESKSVCVHEGIESTCLLLRNQCEATEHLPAIEITERYASLPMVECYAGQLNQVFMNVLSNAIDAIRSRQHEQIAQEIEPEVGTIEIITGMSELYDRPSVLVRIQDNGTGIPENVINQIFNPFFTTKEIGQGTGLGLSISYQIITEKHRGRLECVSVVDAGTEIQIEIPLRHHIDSFRNVATEAKALPKLSTALKTQQSRIAPPASSAPASSASSSTSSTIVTPTNPAARPLPESNISPAQARTQAELDRRKQGDRHEPSDRLAWNFIPKPTAQSKVTPTSTAATSTAAPSKVTPTPAVTPIAPTPATTIKAAVTPAPKPPIAPPNATPVVLDSTIIERAQPTASPASPGETPKRRKEDAIAAPAAPPVLNEWLTRPAALPE
jgi:signal transduction histidine kinase